MAKGVWQDKMRRFGEPKKHDVRYKLRSGAYAILLRGGKLLLTHQAEPEPEYQLPGGGIDPGENILPALHREIIEETGWRVTDLKRLGAYRRFTFMPEYDLWAEKICHMYLGRPVRRLGEPTEAGHTAVWTTPDIGAEIVASEGDAAFLRDHLL